MSIKKIHFYPQEYVQGFIISNVQKIYMSNIVLTDIKIYLKNSTNVLQK